MAVLAASIMAAITVRRLFGYSFTTWRFHLRGETIRSAVDIGWIHTLTVGRMMRSVQDFVTQETMLQTFRAAFPLGSAQRVIVTDSYGRYVGLAYPAEAHGLPDGDGVVESILHHEAHFLRPEMNVRDALTAFEAAEADALVVLDGAETRQILGVLTEQFALKRYNEELERRRRELAGEA
jgi:CIC family chloride channel protein